MMDDKPVGASPYEDFKPTTTSPLHHVAVLCAMSMALPSSPSCASALLAIALAWGPLPAAAGVAVRPVVEQSARPIPNPETHISKVATAIASGEAPTAPSLTAKQERHSRRALRRDERRERRAATLGLGLGIFGVALLVGGLVAGSAGAVVGGAVALAAGTAFAIVGRRELTDNWIYEGFEIVAAGVLLVALGAYWVYDRYRPG